MPFSKCMHFFYQPSLSGGPIKTHITKIGAAFLLVTYISVYSFFIYENEDND